VDALWHQFAAAVVVASVSVLAASDSPQQAFAREWEGRTVVVRQTLYSLVYNERGRLGKTYSGRRDGLTVATPSNGVFFQFDGRQGRDDVADPNPQRVFEQVATLYQEEALDVRSYRKIEPLSLARYDANVELTVKGVRVTRDTVRLTFGVSSTADGDATSLTIKWPVPFSPSFSERQLVEALISGFVQAQPVATSLVRRP